MKSFKEFLMEEDEQNSNSQYLKDLNDFLKDDNIKVEDIDQEIIVKYLICKSLANPKKNFNLKMKESNNILQNFKDECVNLLQVTEDTGDLGRKITAIDGYIYNKYKQRISYLLLKTNEGIDANTNFKNFLENAEEIIKKRLEEAEKNTDTDTDTDTDTETKTEKEKKKDLEQTETKTETETEKKKDLEQTETKTETEKKKDLEQTDPHHANSGNGGNNENYGTTRQGSYLGRFTSAQMEDIMSGNEDKIANALGVMAKAAKDRCDELLSQVKEKVEKNSKYLKEEETAQKVLWEGIFNRLPKQEKLKVQKQHGTKSIYKDEDNQKLTEIINKYKAQIDNLVKTTVDNCQPLGEKLHAFSTSAKMEDKLKEQIRMNVRNFTNKLYDITLEVEKASRKSGFFENRKIEKEAKKEVEWNKFKNSDKGENFNRRLSEKTEAIKKELLKILPNIQKASNEAEVNIKLVSKLIKDSTNANDFFTKASTSKKIIENGRKISIFDWLQKRGIPLPINKEINDKYSKDLTVASWNELFKDKKFLNSLNGYGENFDNFKVAYDNLKNSRNLEDFEKLKKQFGEEFGAEINVFCKDFIELEQQQKGNGGANGTNGTNEKNKQEQQEGKLDPKGFRIPEDDVDGDDLAANAHSSVTTNSCDGLPIGARKYSKAVRRRMNYALNKYL